MCQEVICRDEAQGYLENSICRRTAIKGLEDQGILTKALLGS